MNKIHLNEKLVSEIHTYLGSTYYNLNKQEELDDFFGLLSPSLTKRVKQHLYRDLLLNSHLLTGVDSVILDTLVNSIDNRLFNPEQTIIRQFEAGKNLHQLKINHYSKCNVLFGKGRGFSSFTQ
jgi:hypothetical protein